MTDVVEAPVRGVSDVWPLVLRAQAGDAEAFGKLYEWNFPFVYKFVYFRVRNAVLAEDLTSETFVRALARIDSFTWQGRDIGAWFITIARNLIADYFKSGRFRFEMTVGSIVDAYIDIDDHRLPSSPEEVTVDYFSNVALLTAVKQLSPEHQECLTLRFLCGLSIIDAAQAMGKDEGAFKSLQFRAIRNLRKKLPNGLEPLTTSKRRR